MTTGIGAAVSKAFVNGGCRCIAITDINKEKLERTREELTQINGDVVVLTAAGDVADERFVNAFVNSVVAETGRIDYAVRLFYACCHEQDYLHYYAGQLRRYTGQQPVIDEYILT